MKKGLSDFKVRTADGSEMDLSQFKGKVVLIVNVASRCGYTPQYTGLEELFQKYKDRGFVVLGFPCNQFGAQEPGTNNDIQQFCALNFGVHFPVFAKINVNGDGADPLYQWLKESAPGIFGTEMIKWNFTKFLVGKDGQVIERLAPQVEPKDIAAAIEKALA